MSNMKLININEMECILKYCDGGAPTKYMKENNYVYLIKIRYDLTDFDNINKNIGFILEKWTKNSNKKKKDVEDVNKYEFNKIMDYNNEGGLYEKCGLFCIYTKISDSNNIVDYIYNFMINNVNKKTKKTTFKSNSTSINSCNIIIKNRNKLCYTGDNGTDIKYKINILSLGRYNDKLGTTHKILCKLKINHYLFCEDHEYINYNNWINKDYCKLINCNHNYSIDLNEGGQHIRNYIIDYWKNKNENFIWMLDDNIIEWVRYNNGYKYTINSKEIFTSVEHFINHYDNIGICSHNFESLVNEKGIRKCLVKNEKNFSSLLINLNTNIYFRFKYNEDHIFSIDNIMNGYQSICFNHIQYKKKDSGTQKGGNENIYNSSGNQEGYNKKCFETIDLLNKDIKNGIIILKNDKLYSTNKKLKKGIIIKHLKIDYRSLINYDLELNKIKPMTNFNSNMILK